MEQHRNNKVKEWAYVSFMYNTTEKVKTDAHLVLPIDVYTRNGKQEFHDVLLHASSQHKRRVAVLNKNSKRQEISPKFQ